MLYLYIIQCADKTLYTGITTDIPRRIQEHNLKSGASYTRTRTPIELVYQESYPTRSAASKRETQIKRWTREQKLALIHEQK